MSFFCQCQNAMRYGVAMIAACVATPWAWYHQRKIRRLGRSLTTEEGRIASMLGLATPDDVWIMEVEQVPNPLRKWASCLGPNIQRQIAGDIDGITLGQGIYIKKVHASSMSLIAHELVHIRQYQQAKSVWNFMCKYIYQCLSDGYYDAAWEVEARKGSAEVIGQSLPRN